MTKVHVSNCVSKNLWRETIHYIIRQWVPWWKLLWPNYFSSSIGFEFRDISLLLRSDCLSYLILYRPTEISFHTSSDSLPHLFHTEILCHNSIHLIPCTILESNITIYLYNYILPCIHHPWLHLLSQYSSDAVPHHSITLNIISNLNWFKYLPFYIWYFSTILYLNLISYFNSLKA